MCSCVCLNMATECIEKIVESMVIVFWFFLRFWVMFLVWYRGFWQSSQHIFYMAHSPLNTMYCSVFDWNLKYTNKRREQKTIRTKPQHMTSCKIIVAENKSINRNNTLLAMRASPMKAKFVPPWWCEKNESDGIASSEIFCCFVWDWLRFDTPSSACMWNIENCQFPFFLLDFLNI